MLVVLILKFGSSALGLKRVKPTLGAIPLQVLKSEQGGICSHNLVICLVQLPQTNNAQPRGSCIIHLN